MELLKVIIVWFVIITYAFMVIIGVMRAIEEKRDRAITLAISAWLTVPVNVCIWYLMK